MSKLKQPKPKIINLLLLLLLLLHLVKPLPPLFEFPPFRELAISKMCLLAIIVDMAKHGQARQGKGGAWRGAARRIAKILT